MDTSNIKEKEKEIGVKTSADERDPLVDKPAHYTATHIEAIDYISRQRYVKVLVII